MNTQTHTHIQTQIHKNLLYIEAVKCLIKPKKYAQYVYMLSILIIDTSIII